MLREHKAPRYVDFVVMASRAKEHMISWRDEQWFVPLDMTARFHNAETEPLFCPYHLFTGTVLTEKGLQEFIDVAPDLPSCAPLVRGDRTILDREMVAKLAPWQFGHTTTFAMAEAAGHPLAARAGGFRAVKVLPALPPAQVWENEVAAVVRKQIESVYGRVRAIDEVAYRTVYAPVYLSCYEYNGTPYTFALNGQTGARWGQKPLGFGVTRAFVKLVTGSETSAATSVRVCRGAELNSEDSCSVYVPDAEYFVLPSSDQFIAAAAVGYAELENTSRASVTIIPQWRSTTKTAKTLTIRPQFVVSPYPSQHLDACLLSLNSFGFRFSVVQQRASCV